MEDSFPEEANAIGDPRKNDRDRSTLTIGSRLRVLLPDQHFAPKFERQCECQPIKLQNGTRAAGGHTILQYSLARAVPQLGGI